jgi:hypothetical protein
MASLVEIPQDIIDSIIAAVDDDYDGIRLLKTCALVSSSFLLPSRKRLFSRLYLRSEKACQTIHQFLVENPVVQSFVKNIAVNWGYYSTTQMNGTSLLCFLRLSFCCLESFSITVRNRSNWNDFSSELKDALLTILHFPTLKILYFTGMNVPIMLFQGICLTKLVLHDVLPQFDLEGKKPRPLTWAASEGVATTSHTVIDECVWRFHYPVYGTRFPSPAYFSLIWYIADLPEPTFLPLMSHLRVFTLCINPLPPGTWINDFDILPFLIQSLLVTLSSPATLEHVKLYLDFSDVEDRDALLDDLHDAGVWKQLDSIITHPTGSRLQRVDINIAYQPASDNESDDIVGTGEADVANRIFDALPLLREKGVLFVEATFYSG